MVTITEGKHGTYVIKPCKDSDYDVTVYDNTEDGINEAIANEIAYVASRKPIYWSDDRLCHWIFDFKCCGHWCEGLFHNNGLPNEVESLVMHMHVNVYE